MDKIKRALEAQCGTFKDVVDLSYYTTYILNKQLIKENSQDHSLSNLPTSKMVKEESMARP